MTKHNTPQDEPTWDIMSSTSNLNWLMTLYQAGDLILCQAKST